MYVYRPEVLRELARHGLKPRTTTTPQQLRDAVRDLYKFEIRRLRNDYLAGQFPKREFAGRVVQLRMRYQILSLPIESWLVGRP